MLGFFGLLAYIVKYGLPSEGSDVLLIMVGALAAMTTQVGNYFFGSSTGSKNKDEIIADLKAGEDLGVETVEDLEALVNETMSHPTHQKTLERGRKAYYNEFNNVLVVESPNDPDGGTVYSPEEELGEFEGMK